MKIKSGQTVYYCDHCNKRMLRKGAMERHEKWCARNPENRRACENCAHLEETTIEICCENLFSHTIRKAKAFRCKMFDKLIYPLKVEQRGLPEKYPETFEEQEPMPKVCEHFNDKYFSFL